MSANCSVTTETVASYRYEISMLSPEGEALQPPESERVTLAFDLPEAFDESLECTKYTLMSTIKEQMGMTLKDGRYVVARGTDLQVPFGHGHKWITSEKQNSAARAGLEAVANLLFEAFSRHEYGGACTLVSGTLALCCAQGMRRRRKGRDEDKAS